MPKVREVERDELAFEPRPAWLQNLNSSWLHSAELQHFSHHSKFYSTAPLWRQEKKDAGERKRKVKCEKFYEARVANTVNHKDESSYRSHLLVKNFMICKIQLYPFVV